MLAHRFWVDQTHEGPAHVGDACTFLNRPEKNHTCCCAFEFWAVQRKRGEHMSKISGGIWTEQRKSAHRKTRIVFLFFWETREGYWISRQRRGSYPRLSSDLDDIWTERQRKDISQPNTVLSVLRQSRENICTICCRILSRSEKDRTCKAWRV